MQQKLAEPVSVTVGYISKVETERPRFSDDPSEKFIHKLVDALNCDVDELLLPTDRVPEAIRKRIQERREAFRKFAALNDNSMDRILREE